MSRPAVAPTLLWARAIARPELCRGWSLAEWERAVRLARRLRLLGRLAESIEAAGLMTAVPEPARPHLLAELRYSRWRVDSLLWVLDRVAAMLGDTPYPRVLLKGAAYVGQDLAVARGRMPSDADILVPRASLADARQRLRDTGWVEAPLDDHDRRYYDEWTHEAPPLRHEALGLELDLHHNILPPVARNRVDAGLLLDRLRDSRLPGWKVLDPADQLLHGAAHLFFDSEIRDRLRDLVDFDGLVRHWGGEPGFWPGLLARAEQLGLTGPLALAVHYGTTWLETPVPEPVANRLAQAPGRLRRAALQALVTPLLTPTDPDARSAPLQSAAAQVFLVKHHLWRMPLRLLVPHLWHKAASRRRAGAEAASTPAAADAGGDRIADGQTR